MRQRSWILAIAWLVLPVAAAEPAQRERPELERPVAAPQAVGAVHALRTIPEACARIEGLFTGQAQAPYRFSVARTSPQCQPRARLVDAEKANASSANGWILNDVVRVPSAACPSQQAVVRIWRRPAASAAPPQLDAQGRSRIYLRDAAERAKAGAAALPVYAAALGVEGRACTD